MRVLVGAHNDAVTAALAYLDESAVMVRRGHDGTTVEAGEGFIAAAYLHRMSRSLDPHLHTHVVAANLTPGPDGRFTALHGAPLYRAAKTVGYLYQAHLHATIGNQLGLGWGRCAKAPPSSPVWRWRSSLSFRSVVRRCCERPSLGGSAWTRRRVVRLRRSRPAIGVQQPCCGAARRRAWSGSQGTHRLWWHAVRMSTLDDADSTSRLRVLVVDDESSITELVSLGLRYEGFEVLSAADGRGALRAVREFEPALVILDVRMPDIDGFEVCRRMRADGIWVPVIFLTARDATEDKVAGLTIGGDDYLTKPFSLDELVARVRAIVRRAIGAGEQAASSRLQFADLTLDEDRLEVYRGDRLIALTPTEFGELLSFPWVW
jgi:two-component system OmpR family response regulator